MSAALVLLATLAVPPPPPTCKTADRRIEALIEAKARETGGVEYCQARLYHSLDDLDGDEREDFVLVFSIEGPSGGNDLAQYLAVFPSGKAWKPDVRKVGQRGERFVDQIDVEDGQLVLLTSEYETGDPSCCPSGEGELVFRLEKGRIVPVPAGPAAGPRPTT